MALSSGSDNTLIKSEMGTPDGVWRDEHDRLPLKQRLKMLFANNRLSGLCDMKLEKESKIASTKDDQSHHSQGFHHGCPAPKGMSKILLPEQNNAGGLGECIGGAMQNWSMLSEVNLDTVRVKEVATGASVLLHSSAPLKYPIRVKTESPDNNIMSSAGNCGMGSTDIPDDFGDYLDHIVLKERRRFLLSRESLEITQHVSEGNSPWLSNPVVEDMIQQSCEKVKEDSNSGDGKSSLGGNHTHDILERNSSYFWETLECGSLNGIIAGGSLADTLCAGMTRSGEGTESIKSGNDEGERIGSSREASTIHRSHGGHDLGSNGQNGMHTTASTNFINVKAEPLDSHDLHSPGKDVLGNFPLSKIVSVKEELKTPDGSVEDEIDHMLLEDRINMMASRKVPHLDISGNFKCSGKILPSALDRNPTVSESTKPIRISRPKKRKKTATDSTEIALEEDVPGLLQVLIEKGISINEIKLYGEMESDEALDDSFSEESFAELEDVMSKLFSQRESLLKFAPMRCKKGEKASYCLACLLSLVEQARYLQFRKWPVEWGWCRDLQSFIFVFERHNRIVLERPEYGYATYFFELNDSIPTNWQIKRLVTAMKVTNHSRITLIENKALMVGEDLTEGEARVLMEYGWIPNTGLGTMLNYCDRVVHDRKNESDSSEWRSKIGKLLMNGFNSGTIVSTEIPKKAMESSGSESPLIKLEL